MNRWIVGSDGNKLQLQISLWRLVQLFRLVLQESVYLFFSSSFIFFVFKHKLLMRRHETQFNRGLITSDLLSFLKLLIPTNLQLET